MTKRKWCVVNNGKISHLFIPSKTATLVLEFAVEYLPLDRTAALLPEFQIKELPWGEHSDDDDTVSFLWFANAIYRIRWIVLRNCEHVTSSFVNTQSQNET